MKKNISTLLIVIFASSTFYMTGNAVDISSVDEIPTIDRLDEKILDDEVETIEKFSDDEEEPAAVEVIVPIYNYEIDNVIVPTAYEMSLNPYEIPVRVEEGMVSTEQVISRKYGIINKSTTDKIVTVTLEVEDLNGDKITFVDSAEAAENADKDTYAVYLSVIPADERGIKIGGMDANQDTTSSDLSNVEMSAAKEQRIALHEGENQVKFKLSKALYELGEDSSDLNERPEGKAEEVLDLIGLNPNGKSATAFTFGGTMNRKAEWEKLLKGIKITAVYNYETADGSEQVIEGTGAMVFND